MRISQLIKDLEDVKEKYGDLEVGYIDNGDFSENNGWAEPEVMVCRDSENEDYVVVL